jgi:hypothetical protein
MRSGTLYIFAIDYSINRAYHIHILEFPSVRPSVCARLTFYWKELRRCNMAQHFRLLPEQIIGYLTFFFFLKKNFGLFF